VEEEHREPGVDEEGGGSSEHAAGFDGGVGRAVGFDGEREGGQGHGGRGTEKAGETFGSEDGAEKGETGDKESADKETEEELDEHEWTSADRLMPVILHDSRIVTIVLQVFCGGYQVYRA
jgi:hypothetical protein